MHTLAIAWAFEMSSDVIIVAEISLASAPLSFVPQFLKECWKIFETFIFFQKFIFDQGFISNGPGA